MSQRIEVQQTAACGTCTHRQRSLGYGTCRFPQATHPTELQRDSEMFAEMLRRKSTTCQPLAALLQVGAVSVLAG